MLPSVDIRSVYRIYYPEFALFFLCAGLFLKPLVAKPITVFSFGRLILANASMNVASYLSLGAAVPGAMLLCLYLNRAVLKPILGTDDIASIVWLSVVSIATVISAAIEALVLRSVFRQRIGSKAYFLLFGANALCMAIALYGLLKYIRANPPES